MTDSTAPVRPTPLLTTFFRLLAAHRPAVSQERVFVRLAHLTIGSVLCLGRHTVSQILVALGLGDVDWSASYRLFNQERVDIERLHDTLVEQVVAVVPETAPSIVVGVDATQLPRSTRTMPGSGYTVNPRSPKWQRGIHFAQRFVCISLLLPLSTLGDSRAVPLKGLLLRSAKTTPMGDEPERTENQGALALMAWVRTRLDTLGRASQVLVVVGDGAYSTASVLMGLPERVMLVARCAKNRALFTLPTYRPEGRGRQPRYGVRALTPQETLHADGGWRDYSFAVRGRAITVTAKLTGPFVVKPAYLQPVMLVVVRGVDRGKGVTRRQRDPQFFLISIRMTEEDEWELERPLIEVLQWLWQRWEVEVMHKELKSGFGLGEQQAFSDAGAAGVVSWMLWVYALLVLTGYLTWQVGTGTIPDSSRWWKPRRWSFAKLWQGFRQELWQLGEFQPVWQRSPDTWTEITAWIGAQTNATKGFRRL